MTHGNWIHFGCGMWAPEGWTNFDCSPTLRLQRLPLLGRLAPVGPEGRFPPAVRYGDIVRGLPVPAETASLVYSSHVLEHLSLEDLRRALRNARRVMRPGAVFRAVLPDLEHLIKAYAADFTADAAVTFMDDTLLGERRRSRGLGGLARQWLGNSRHLWMWDYKSLAAELQAAGFTSVRRAEFHDSEQEAFRLVETAGRWENALGVECRA
jgi:SAM-dependent methyltransferase